MIGNLFDSPWKILIVALVIIVLFWQRARVREQLLDRLARRGVALRDRAGGGERVVRGLGELRLTGLRLERADVGDVVAGRSNVVPDPG